MSLPISPRLWKILICPSCAAPLQQSATGADCSGCGGKYLTSEEGQLDLRLKKPKRYTLEFVVGKKLLPDDGFDFCPLPLKENSEVDFSDMKAPVI